MMKIVRFEIEMDITEKDAHIIDESRYCLDGAISNMLDAFLDAYKRGYDQGYLEGWNDRH